MFTDDDSPPPVETVGEPTPGTGAGGSAFGLRAAILAGLVAAAAGGVIVGICEDPVQMIANAGSTCCPPQLGS